MIVLKYFMQNEQDSTISKERVKKIQTLGNRMYKNKEIEHIEALSRITYKNADSFYNSNGVKGSENKEKITYYSDAIKTYLNCLN